MATDDLHAAMKAAIRRRADRLLAEGEYAKAARLRASAARPGPDDDPVLYQGDVFEGVAVKRPELFAP